MDYQAEPLDMHMRAGSYLPRGWEFVPCEIYQSGMIVGVGMIDGNLPAFGIGSWGQLRCVIYIGPDYVGQRKD